MARANRPTQPAGPLPQDPLTPREYQVAKLLLQGCDNPAIARELKMKVVTVEKHKSRLFRRFRVGGQVDLATELELYLRSEVVELQEPPESYARLTQQEKRVAGLVALGLSNCDAAEILETTEGVVKNYLRSIYDKLGWSGPYAKPNKVELALWWWRYEPWDSLIDLLNHGPAARHDRAVLLRTDYFQHQRRLTDALRAKLNP
jgi:DNA-binding NarL/FixJ family response regulator